MGTLLLGVKFGLYFNDSLNKCVQFYANLLAKKSVCNW